MVVLTVAFALFSACLNAVAAILQRRATGQVAPSQLFRSSILQAVMNSRMWLTGIGLQIAGFFAQAVALHSGSLVIVAPLLTTDLIFLVGIMHFYLHLRLGVREWSAVVLLCSGLSGLLVALSPRGGAPVTNFGHWFEAFLVIAALIVAGAVAIRRIVYLPLRAVLGGATAGLHFAFTAVATKLVLAQLSFGIWHEFIGWQLYALIVVGVSSALSMQSMYGSGPLTITQPSMEIVEAGAGVAFGILLFGDYVNHDAVALIVAVLSGLVLFVSIILLAGSRRLMSQASRL